MEHDEAIPLGVFELLEPIGEGGMARVWRGRHLRQEAPVAVKIMDRDALEGGDGMAAFREEVRAHASLDHPTVATLFDYGGLPAETAETTDGEFQEGLPYLVMEHAADGTVADAPPPSSWNDCRDLLVALLDALAHAHARDLVHRDLKPSNVLRFPDAPDETRWRIADFGIAHAANRVRERGTADVIGSSACTPFYSAPEQIRGEWRRFGPWTDLYQLGCMAFELVCGGVPYRGDSIASIFTAHLHDPRPALEPRFPVPEGLEEWIRRLMSRDPAERHRRAADAADALLPLELEQPAAIDDESPSRDTSAENPLDSPPDDPSTDADSPDIQPTRVDDAVEIATNETRVDSTHPSDVSPPDTATRPPSPTDDGMAPHAGAHRQSASPDSLSSDTPTDATDPTVPPSWGSKHDIRRRLGGSGSGDEASGESDHRRNRSRRFVDVGLGLFGLREIPFVDRNAERDRIWETLLHVAVDEKPHALFVRSPAGRGKSRLVEWMVRRGHELGACHVLKATHGRQGGTGHGLDGMLQRWLQSWNLDRSRVHELVDHRLRSVWPADTATDELDEIAAGLTELVRPTSDGPGDTAGPPYRFGSQTARYALLCRFLSALGAPRPVAIWFDDLQRGSEAAALLEHLLDRDLEAPVLCLGTVRDDDPAENSAATERIESLRERESVDTFRLDPLDVEDQEALVSSMLPLAADVVDEVRSRARGNPLFAVQLVEDWVARDLLVPTDRGFELDGSPAETSNTLPDMWTRRVERAVSVLPDARRPDAWRALELAATLGERVDTRVWRAATRELDVEPPTRFVEDELIDRGLAERVSDGWVFIHGGLAEILRRRADRQDRLQDHHRACALALEKVDAEETNATWARIADHWVGAGERKRALEPLGEAARLVRHRHGDLHRQVELLERRRELMDDCGVPRTDRRRVANQSHLAWARYENGDLEGARELAKRVRDAADVHNWPRISARAERLIGEVLRNRGEDLVQAERHLDRAEFLCQRADDTLGLARCRETRGRLLENRGDYRRARASSQEAKERYEELGKHAYALGCELEIAWCLLGEGDYEQAERRARRIAESAEGLGAVALRARAFNLVGDSARFDERWPTALEAYRRSLELASKVGRDNAAAANESNALQTLLGDGRWRDVERRLPEFRERIDRSGWDFLLLHYRMCSMACAAHRDDWDRWDAHAEALRDGLENFENRARDEPWLAEHCAETALNSGATERAQRMYELARDLWREIDAERDAERVSERLDDLEAA